MSWAGFIEQARRSLSDPDFENRERVYKLQIAESLRGVLAAAARDEDWRTELRRALGRTYGIPPFRAQYNLSRFSQHQWLHKLPDEYAEEARAVLAGMLAQQDPVERFAAFADLASARADSDGAQPGAVLALGSVLNMAIDPTLLPPLKTTVLRHAEDKVGFPKAPDDIAEAYSHHLNFIDECSKRLDEAGIVVQDRLDIQSILWEWDTSDAEGNGPDALAASVAAFRVDYPYSDEEKADKAVDSLALAERCRPALSREALDNPNWEAISSIFSSTLHGNLGPAKSAPLNLIASGTDEDRQRFAEAIRGLLHGDADLATRLDTFLEADLPGIRETVAMKLLSIAEPARVLHVFKVRGQNGKAELMALPPVSLEVPDGASTGELAAKTNDLIRERLAPHFGDDCYGMTRYLYWLSDQVAPDGGDEPEEGDPEGLEDLRKTLYLDDGGWLDEAVDLLGRKRQLILYGPPGTGKTYIALALMKHLAPQSVQREVVQFHPSYSYEDFVRGYRPVDRDGQLTYRVVEGPLIRLAETARESLEAGDDSPHILLIDEINRGNLPRILGELLYLLEYRSDEDGVQLMYTNDPDERFTLPKNLWIIGTMNTADRSIGLIDAALRRRFHFKSLFPGEHPIKGTLRRWLHDHTSADVAEHAADHVDRLNERLMEQQGSYGENLKVGHSYFMEKDLDLGLFDRIWTSDVLPYLEEQLFGREVDVAKTFSLKALESGGGPEAEAGEDAEGSGPSDESEGEGLLTDAGNGS